MTPIRLPLPKERADWLKARKIGLGGSDIAGILGLSKWNTPLDVYNSKTSDEIDDSDNSSMEWGRRLEPVIRQKYADVTGRIVIQPDCMFQHPVHKFMIANVDGLVDDGRILEIKTARSIVGWGDEGTDEIPDYYKTQVQHYMTVVGAKVCDVAVLIGASDFRIYTVHSDPELEALLIESEQEFWNEHVLAKVPPAPMTVEETKALYPTSKNLEKECSDEIFNAANELLSLREDIKLLEEREKELLAQIQEHMGECEKLKYAGQIIATWKTSKPVARVDTTELKKTMPDIYNQFLKLGNPSRRFTLKL